MNGKHPLRLFIEEMEVSLAVRRHLRARGPHFIVTHRNCVPGAGCLPGEAIDDAALGGFVEPHSLRLARTSLLLMDCLCKYRVSLTALRIEEIMKSEPFYTEYGLRQRGCDQILSRPDRNSVRVYISRIREQMKRVFLECGLNLDPKQVLVAENTDSNTTAYRLRATAEFVHIDMG